MNEPPQTPFRWCDLVELGIPEFTLRRWLRDGLVRRVITGVYCDVAQSDSLTLRAQCARLVIPAGAVVCDRSAAWLWGIDVLDPGEQFDVPDLEVAVPPGRPRLRRSGVCGLERELVSFEIAEVHGVRVTTPLRTAVDLACLRGRWRALAALDSFMREFALSHDDLSRQLTRFGRRRGVTQARELAAIATPVAESPGESWTRGAIHDGGLPEPVAQVDVFDNGAFVGRVDLAYPHLRIAVEYDGERFHGEDQREHDEARRRRLRDLGWIVIVVRKHQFQPRELEAWLAELAAGIAMRSQRGSRRYTRRPEPWVKR